MSTKVAISKSPPVVVQPLKPVPATGDINLSAYDKYLVSKPTIVLLVFEHPIQEPVATIKRGLSRALVHYYPIAGRLAAGATAGEVVIKCDGEMCVSFVAASANCTIRDVEDLSDPLLKEKLVMSYEGGRCRFSDPLVLMQVTVFSCGGFVLGVTWNHSVADGVGMSQFLQAVGELSRGLPCPTVVPVRYAGAKEGYYGNCLVWRMVTATARAVATGHVMDLVKMIDAAKNRVPDESDMDKLLQLTDCYNIFRITLWRNIGLEAPDFGAGTPARAMAHWPEPHRDVPKCTGCIPCVDEYNVLSACVKEDHASPFLHELADMHLNYV